MAEDVTREYRDSLDELTFNSKIHINVLTVLAEENIQYAEVIVGVIEEHLQRVRPDQKLPCLYLMDSILKNVHASTRYRELFSENIVDNFGKVFDVVDEKVRLSMWKLRRTWPEFITNEQLYKLDLLINTKDPNWPIMTTPTLPASIHPEQSLAVLPDETESDEALRAELLRKEEEEKREEEEQRKREEEERKRREEEEQARIKEEIFAQEKELMRLDQIKLQQELLEMKRKLQMKETELQLQKQRELLKQKTEEKAKQNSEKKAAVASTSAQAQKQLPTANHSTAGDRKQLPTAHHSAAGDRKQLPTTNHSTAGDRKQLPTANHSTAGDRLKAGEGSSSNVQPSNRDPRLAKERSPTEQNAGEPEKKRLKKRSEGSRLKRSGSPSKEKSEAPEKKRRREADEKKDRSARRRRDVRKEGSRHKKSASPTEETSSAKQGSSAKAPGLSDDLADLFGKEDVDYRKLPPIPKRSSQADLSSAANPQVGWNKFKEKRPEEFPFKQPRDLRSSADFQSPLVRQYSNAQTNELSYNVGGVDDSGLKSTDEIRRVVEERRSQGQISEEMYAEICDQLQELQTLQQQQERNRQMRNNSARFSQQRPRPLLENPPSKVPLLPEPSEPFANDSQYSNSSMPGGSGLNPTLWRKENSRSPVFNENSRSPMHGDQGAGVNSKPLLPPPPPPPTINSGQSLLPLPVLPGRGHDETDSMATNGVRNEKPPLQPPPAPPIAREVEPPAPGFYVPENDHRWFMRLKRVEKFSSYHIVIDSRRFELKKGRLNRIFLGHNTEIGVKVKPKTREVVINGKVQFLLGEPKKQVKLGKLTCWLLVYGPQQKLWIDNFPYELHMDAPPERVLINSLEHSVAIDSSTTSFVVDDIAVCPYEFSLMHKAVFGGAEHSVQFFPPLRQILIDGSLCDLDLSRKIPAVVVNGERRGIMFRGEPREIWINEQPYIVPMDRVIKVPLFGQRMYTVGFGGPGHEIIIDEEFYECKFGAPPVTVKLGFKSASLHIPGQPPEVKILGVMKSAEELQEEAEARFHNGRRGLRPPGPVMGMNQPRPAGPHGPLMQPPAPAPRPPMPPGARPPDYPGLQQPPGPMYSVTTAYQQPQQVSQPPAPQVDVNSLLSRLMETGMIKAPAQPPAMPPAAESENQAEPEEAPAAEEEPPIPILNWDDVKKYNRPFPQILKQLKSGKQCASCGMRLPPERYQLHLDWHFRKNKREKEESKMLHCRGFYPPASDWIHYEQVGDLKQSQFSDYFENMLSSIHRELKDEDKQTNQIEDAETEPLAKDNPDENVCAVCGDPFDQYFNDDLEEWHLREAIKVDDSFYHPVCYEDSTEAKLRRSTPTAELDAENPGQSSRPVLPDPINDPLGYLQALTQKSTSTSAADAPGSSQEALTPFSLLARLTNLPSAQQISTSSQETRSKTPEGVKSEPSEGEVRSSSPEGIKTTTSDEEIRSRTPECVKTEPSEEPMDTTEQEPATAPQGSVTNVTNTEPEPVIKSEVPMDTSEVDTAAVVDSDAAQDVKTESAPAQDDKTESAPAAVEQSTDKPAENDSQL